MRTAELAWIRCSWAVCSNFSQLMVISPLVARISSEHAYMSISKQCVTVLYLLLMYSPVMCYLNRRNPSRTIENSTCPSSNRAAAIYIFLFFPRLSIAFSSSNSVCSSCFCSCNLMRQWKCCRAIG